MAGTELSAPQPSSKAADVELRHREKAAKLRHRAAKARLKATRLEEKSRVLFAKAAELERAADQHDGVVQAALHPTAKG